MPPFIAVIFLSIVSCGTLCVICGNVLCFMCRLLHQFWAAMQNTEITALPSKDVAWDHVFFFKKKGKIFPPVVSNSTGSAWHCVCVCACAANVNSHAFVFAHPSKHRNPRSAQGTASTPQSLKQQPSATAGLATPPLPPRQVLQMQSAV